MKSGTDKLTKIWLGRWFLVQTFEDKDEDLEQEIREIQELFEQSRNDGNV